MRLSTKTRYGVRAVFDIAFNSQGVATQAKEIARREDIPLRYLEQIFQDLKRAGIVESKRGPRGGYFLRRGPEEITLADVVVALQGSIHEMFTTEGQESTQGSQKVTTDLWRELADHVNDWFTGITIADLVSRGDQLGLARADAGQPMYFI